MKLLILLGSGLTAFGLFWFIGGLRGGYIGSDVQLIVGLLSAIFGSVLVILGGYDTFKVKPETSTERS